MERMKVRGDENDDDHNNKNNIRDLNLSAVKPSSIHVLSGLATAVQVGKHEIDITIWIGIHKAMKDFSMLFTLIHYIHLSIISI